MKNPELFKRVFTGIPCAAALVFLVLYPLPIYFSLIVILVAILAAWEYFTMSSSDINLGLKILGTGLTGAVSVLIYVFGYSAVPLFITASVLAVFIYLLFFCKDMYLIVNATGKTVLGIIYIGLFLSYAIGIKTFKNGGWWLLFLFSIVWMNDTFAFFIGKRFGKTKLAPVISPNKTIEGAAGGLIAVVGTAIIFNALLLKELGILHVILLSVSLGVLCQFGDMFESMLKRSAGVKDSGSFLPGHGGVLDRIDSTIITLPFFYYYLFYFL